MNFVRVVGFGFVFKDEHGLHARPAGELAREVNRLSSSVTITVPKSNKSAPANKIFTLMGLGITKGESVVVRVEGDNANAEVDGLKQFISNQFAEGGVCDSLESGELKQFENS